MSGLDGLKTNATTKDLLINDDEYLGSSAQYAEIGRLMNESLERFVVVLKATAELTQGVFADNLLNFAAAIDTILTGNSKVILSQLAAHMNAYISDIDAADGEWN